MKKFYVLLAILFIGKFSFSQIFQETFQSGTMPTTFTLINDANTVATNIASLFPTAWSVIAQPSDTANKVAASPSWFTAVAPADRWMITPAIVLPAGSNNTLTWKSKSQDPAYKDALKVLISTTGINKTDFTITAYNVTSEDSAFTTKSYSLQSLAGQTIRVAFVQQSTDMFFVIVDDIKVATTVVGINEVPSEVSNFSVYPNPVKNELNISSTASLKNVKIFNALGQEVINENVSGNHYKVNTSSYIKGIYFVQIESEKGKTTKKFVVSE
ncbi:MAG: T9SS type A sorting domain-containing protein [Bacteroidetes bacterium]|nr:T9SS type A sorting domain-containing protein [Bacteroidota bacterium]